MQFSKRMECFGLGIFSMPASMGQEGMREAAPVAESGILGNSGKTGE